MALSPYKYGDDQTQDGSDSTLTQDNQVGPSANGPAPYSPPKTETQTTAPQPQASPQQQSDAPAPQTFAQMQQAGIARPPAPTSNDSALGVASMPLAKEAAGASVQPMSGFTPQNNLQVMPNQTLGNPNPMPPVPVQTLPNVTPTNTQAAPNTGMTTAQWDAYSPLAGLTEQQKAEYWAGKGTTGLAYGATPTGSAGNPNAGGSVATYGNTSANDASLAAAGAKDPALAGIGAAQAAALGNYSGTNQAGNDASNAANAAQLFGALNNQPGATPNQQIPPGMTYQQWQSLGNPGGAVTPGGPTNPNYNPNAPVQPNNGAVNAQGQYVIPSGPATYLPQGGVSSSGSTTPTTGFTPTNNPTGAPTPNTSFAPTNNTPSTGQTSGGQTLAPTNNASTNVTPSTFDLLNTLTQGAAGQGAGSQVQNATQQAALNLLKNPSPYSEDSVKDLYNWESGNIQDQYDLQRKQLGEQMARRGLGASTIYGGNLNDLNIGQRSAQESLGENLAQNYAQSLGQYQQGAVNTGNTVGSTAQNNAQSWLEQLMGFGQNAFNNDLATNQQNQNQSNSYQNYILQLLGLGYSPTG